MPISASDRAANLAASRSAEPTYHTTAFLTLLGPLLESRSDAEAAERNWILSLLADETDAA